MFDSILNASWWPWSRTKTSTASSGGGGVVGSTTDANSAIKYTTAGSGNVAFVPASAVSSTLSSLATSTAQGDDEAGGGGGSRHRLFESTTTTPSTSPPGSPTIIGGEESVFDFSLSSFYNAINAATNWTRDEQDSVFGIERNFTTFDNYSTNYTNDTVAAGVSVAVTNDSDYSWMVVPPWNCSTCQPPFDSFVNVTTINQTQLQFGNTDESSIYLIQIILTALVLGIVILSTVIGKYHKLICTFKHYLLHLYFNDCRLRASLQTPYACPIALCPSHHWSASLFCY